MLVVKICYLRFVTVFILYAKYSYCIVLLVENQEKKGTLPLKERQQSTHRLFEDLWLLLANSV